MVEVLKPEIKRAYMISWIVESSIGLLIFAILFGTVGMPLFLTVSTAGWGTYAPLLWAIIPLIVIGAYIMRMIDSAKHDWAGPITGMRY